MFCVYLGIMQNLSKKHIFWEISVSSDSVETLVKCSEKCISFECLLCILLITLKIVHLYHSYSIF